MVQNTICCKIHEAGLFWILVDETKDISKKEQITFVLRCIDRKEAAIHEYFLTFVEATSLDAKSVTQYIEDTIKKHQLDLTCIVSQEYDGASVMSGNCQLWVGIAQVFKHNWRSSHHMQSIFITMPTF